jgi:hypothetical protein
MSYFSDFILMQQLMTIEIDLIVGNTSNNIHHLNLKSELIAKKARGGAAANKAWGEDVEDKELL